MRRVWGEGAMPKCENIRDRDQVWSSGLVKVRGRGGGFQGWVGEWRCD